MATKKKNTNAPAKGKKAAAPKAAAAKTAPAKAEPAKSETAKAGNTKPAPDKAQPAKTEAKPKLSLVKAAVAVLGETDEALNTKQMIEQAKAKGFWTPGEGKTPEQTLYSAITREIKAKGPNARFVQVSKGHFKLRPAN